MRWPHSIGLLAPQLVEEVAAHVIACTVYTRVLAVGTEPPWRQAREGWFSSRFFAIGLCRSSIAAGAALL